MACLRSSVVIAPSQLPLYSHQVQIVNQHEIIYSLLKGCVVLQIDPTSIYKDSLYLSWKKVIRKGKYRKGILFFHNSQQVNHPLLTCIVICWLYNPFRKVMKLHACFLLITISSCISCSTWCCWILKKQGEVHILNVFCLLKWNCAWFTF